ASDPEDETTELPESRRLELETDEKEKENDPVLTEVERPLDAAHETKTGRSDERARDEVTEHRPEPDPLGDRDDEHRGGEKDRDLDEHGEPSKSAGANGPGQAGEGSQGRDRGDIFSRSGLEPEVAVGMASR